MLKIQIDMSKKIPQHIVKDIQELMDNVNNYHETKSSKVDKINEAKEKVKIAEPKVAADHADLTGVEDVPSESLVVDATPAFKDGGVITAASANANAIELDVRGYEWDSRIHAKTKAKKADGKWRNKRAVDKGLLEQVEAELTKCAVDNTVTPMETPFDAPPAMIYQPKTYALDTFKNDMFELINDLVNAKLIDKKYIDDMCKYLDLDLGLIQLNRPENANKVELFYNALAEAKLINKV